MKKKKLGMVHLKKGSMEKKKKSIKSDFFIYLFLEALNPGICADRYCGDEA